MTRWKQVGDELALQRKTWVSLGKHLGASKQTVSNWKRTGIPAKNFSKIDSFLNKPLGWTEAGIEFVELVETIKRHDYWPFDLPGLTRDRYESLPIASRYAVQAMMLQSLHREKQEPTQKAKSA
jgi:hypothetical protein